jgi:hypothetical protein
MSVLIEFPCEGREPIPSAAGDCLAIRGSARSRARMLEPAALGGDDVQRFYRALADDAWRSSLELLRPPVMHANSSFCSGVHPCRLAIQQRSVTRRSVVYQRTSYRSGNAFTFQILVRETIHSTISPYHAENLANQSSFGVSIFRQMACGCAISTGKKSVLPVRV